MALTCVPLLGLYGSAHAAGAPVRIENAVRDVAQVQPAAAVEHDDASCSRARRRLWIEGEGWVVRRITTCR